MVGIPFTVSGSTLTLPGKTLSNKGSKLILPASSITLRGSKTKTIIAVGSNIIVLPNPGVITVMGKTLTLNGPITFPISRTGTQVFLTVNERAIGIPWYGLTKTITITSSISIDLISTITGLPIALSNNLITLATNTITNDNSILSLDGSTVTLQDSTIIGAASDVIIVPKSTITAGATTIVLKDSRVTVPGWITQGSSLITLPGIAVVSTVTATEQSVVTTTITANSTAQLALPTNVITLPGNTVKNAGSTIVLRHSIVTLPVSNVKAQGVVLLLSGTTIINEQTPIVLKDESLTLPSPASITAANTTFVLPGPATVYPQLTVTTQIRLTIIKTSTVSAVSTTTAFATMTKVITDTITVSPTSPEGATVVRMIMKTTVTVTLNSISTTTATQNSTLTTTESGGTISEFVTTTLDVQNTITELSVINQTLSITTISTISDLATITITNQESTVLQTVTVTNQESTVLQTATVTNQGSTVMQTVTVTHTPIPISITSTDTLSVTTTVTGSHISTTITTTTTTTHSVTTTLTTTLTTTTTDIPTSSEMPQVTVMRVIESGTPYTTTITPSSTPGTITVIIYETPSPLPDTSCNNLGIQAAIFSSSVGGTASPVTITTYKLEYFANIDPDFSGAITSIDTATTASLISLHGGNFVLSLRMWFYVPRTQIYTFTTSADRDFLALWVGPKALYRWTTLNSDMTVRWQDGAQTAQFQTVLAAGTYAPLRIMVGGSNTTYSYSFDLTGEDNTKYIQNGTSEYFVQQPCDPSVGPFPTWGSELPAPDKTCGNVGFEVAEYENPFTWAGTYFVAYEPAYFKNATVFDTGSTNITGFYILVNQLPPGLKTRPPSYTAYNYRGYFYAPYTETYSFQIANADAQLSMWVGDLAYSGWTGANSNSSVLFAQAVPAPVVKYLTAGSYFPIRILLSDNGGYSTPNNAARWSFTVTDSTGLQYIGDDFPTTYLVGNSCDNVTAPAYPPFGQET
ncbi:hypothetical protein TWF694_006146 [Orbilia ellipsospora]|uniref:PA14 domain-containing protein n=1 Tax=Orbilia ellipsospora TaxID=2528407 RepID=A0AAV9WTJ0_9PEZI